MKIEKIAPHSEEPAFIRMYVAMHWRDELSTLAQGGDPRGCDCAENICILMAEASNVFQAMKEYDNDTHPEP